VLRRSTVAVTLVCLVAIWQLYVVIFAVPSYVLPGPNAVWDSMLANWSQLLVHTQVTLSETLAGFGLGLLIGIPLAVSIVYSPIIEHILYPLLVASQAVPKVALAPLLLVALGYGVWPKIIVAFLIAFFPIVVNTVTGLASVDRDTLRLLRSMGASQWQVFVKVRFPYAVPTMLAGFKVAIALSVVGAVVGEFVGGRSGLGYFMMLATGNFDTPLVFACVIVLTLLGVGLFYTLALVERLFGRWNRAASNARDETAQAWSM
jgi:NitT/TauT family transport system permease protein